MFFFLKKEKRAKKSEKISQQGGVQWGDLNTFNFNIINIIKGNTHKDISYIMNCVQIHLQVKWARRSTVCFPTSLVKKKHANITCSNSDESNWFWMMNFGQEFWKEGHQSNATDSFLTKSNWQFTFLILF